MIASKHPVRYSFREYLRHEEASNVRHEYLDGQIYAMAGGTPEHAALALSVGAQLLAQLRGKGCVVHTSDLRVRVAETSLTTYPDVTIVCGGRERDPEDPNTVVNPRVVIEVLSPSTAEYDRGEKREHYERIPTVTEIVVVAHDRREIEVWTRRVEGWTRRVSGARELAVLESVGATIDVRQAYDDADAVPERPS